MLTWHESPQCNHIGSHFSLSTSMIPVACSKRSWKETRVFSPGRKRSPRGQRMPGTPSGAAAGLHEVLQLLGEDLAGGLCHRSHRVPVLYQLRPQLGVAERVHRHLVSRAAGWSRGDDPVRSSRRPGLRSDARSATVVSRRRGTSPASRLPVLFRSMIDPPSRSPPSRERRSLARSPNVPLRARGRSHPGLTPAARPALPWLRRDAGVASPRAGEHHSPLGCPFPHRPGPGYCAACFASRDQAIQLAR